MPLFWKSFWCALTSIVRDRSVLLLIIIGPIVYSFYYPLPYSPELVRDIPIAVADLDRTSLSRELVRLADASPDLKVMSVLDNPAQLKQAMWDEDIQGGLIIPRGFRRNILRGETAQTVVLGNGAYFIFNRGEVVGFAGAAQALSSQLGIRHELASSVSFEQAKQRSSPIQLELRAVSNPTGGYSTYVVPAVAVVVLQQTLLIGVCILLGSWREAGAPIDMKFRRNRFALVLAAASICFVNTLYYIGIVYWREDYPHLGQLSDLLPVIVIYSLTAAAWSVCIGSFIRYREQALVHLLPTAIPIIFLAGFAWPLESIPAPLVALSTLIPSTAGVQAFLNVDQMGASFIQVLPEVISLTALLFGSLLLIALRKDWPLVVSH